MILKLTVVKKPKRLHKSQKTQTNQIRKNQKIIKKLKKRKLEKFSNNLSRNHKLIWKPS